MADSLPADQLPADSLPADDLRVILADSGLPIAPSYERYQDDPRWQAVYSKWEETQSVQFAIELGSIELAYERREEGVAAIARTLAATPFGSTLTPQEISAAAQASYEALIQIA